MQREVYNKLIDWKLSPYRKPLILEGARQVGKTWLMLELAKSYNNYVGCQILFETPVVF